MDVFIGSCKVVSTLNMGLPASGIRVASGTHEETSSVLSPPLIDSPMIRSPRPAREMGAATEMSKADPSDRIAPAPIRMHSQPEMTRFSLWLGSELPPLMWPEMQ